MKPLSCEEGAAASKEFGFFGMAQEILETIVDGFCAIDKEWRVVYVNLPACEMWGSTPESLIGRIFWEVFPQLTGTDSEKLLRAAVGASAGWNTKHSRRSSRAGCGCASAPCQEV
jgi:PAS domain S-box-containing protein